MNAIVKHEAGVPALAMDRSELRRVLQSSLYPGASDGSVDLVLGYCQAAGLDPLQKPVHIVPMSVKTGAKNQYGDDQYENRDTIMPGIGLYRVQAARTGEYAGMDKPVFGPTKTLAYKRKVTEWVDGANGKRKPVHSYVDAQIEYPEWCEVTVYRVIGGVRCPFTAVEYWIENYATAGKNSDAPNSMWERRVRGQIVKCAEAQALRRGFPEIGAAPTADEMEGKQFEHFVEADDVRPAVVMPQSKSQQPPPETQTEDRPDPPQEPQRAADAKPQVESLSTATGNEAPATVGEKAFIRNKLTAAGIDFDEAMAANRVGDFEALTKSQFAAVKSWIGKQS